MIYGKSILVHVFKRLQRPGMHEHALPDNTAYLIFPKGCLVYFIHRLDETAIFIGLPYHSVRFLPGPLPAQRELNVVENGNADGIYLAVLRDRGNRLCVLENVSLELANQSGEMSGVVPDARVREGEEIVREIKSLLVSMFNTHTASDLEIRPI